MHISKLDNAFYMFFCFVAPASSTHDPGKSINTGAEIIPVVQNLSIKYVTIILECVLQKQSLTPH
jgi:hypothetical protein